MNARGSVVSSLDKGVRLVFLLDVSCGVREDLDFLEQLGVIGDEGGWLGGHAELESLDVEVVQTPPSPPTHYRVRSKLRVIWRKWRKLDPGLGEILIFMKTTTIADLASRLRYAPVAASTWEKRGK